MASGNRRPTDPGSARLRGQGRPSPTSRPARAGRREDRRPAGGPGSSGPRQSTRPTAAPTASGRSGGTGTPPAPRWPAGGPFARRSTRRLAALGAVFVLLAIMIVPTLRAYLQQEAEYSALQEKSAQQAASVAALEAQVKRWDDPAYVEQQARERLKFVRPGETAYQVIGAEKLLGDPLAGRARVISPNRGDHSVPWYGRMWSSIVIADRAPVDGVTPLAPVGAGSSEPPASDDAVPGTSGTSGVTTPSGVSGSADTTGTSGRTGTSGSAKPSSSGSASSGSARSGGTSDASAGSDASGDASRAGAGEGTP